MPKDLMSHPDLVHLRGQTALFYDTKTTGSPDRSDLLEFQPHLVGLAWILGELPKAGDRQVLRVIASANNMVQLPPGVDVPPGAARVHGITGERANTEGFDLREVISTLVHAAELADARIAHNQKFDDKILSITYERLQMGYLFTDDVEPWCTKELCTPILNLPPTARMLRAGFNKPKAPKLEEAHRFFTGQGIEGAHDAMVDVQALVRVFLGVLNDHGGAA